MAGLELWELSYLAAVVGAGSFIRGFTGFGSSMIYVVGLTFALPASEAVPVILLLEIAATVRLLPAVWSQVEWRSVGLLTLGGVVATPVGLAVLTHLPRAPMQAAIAVVVLGVCVLLRAGFRLKRQPKTAGTLLVGLTCGILTGATSTGGPPAVIYYFSGPLAVAIGRASLIALLGALDLLASGMAAYSGLIVGETLLRTALAIPPMVLGTWAGERVFRRADPEGFRRWVIVVLAALSVISFGRATSVMAGVGLGG
jgi:uncharacterized protein